MRMSLALFAQKAPRNPTPHFLPAGCAHPDQTHPPPTPHPNPPTSTSPPCPLGVIEDTQWWSRGSTLRQVTPRPGRRPRPVLQQFNQDLE